MASIEGKNISKAFGGVQALKAASFSAEPGEVHAVVGENGAGKSTMIKILSGLFPADQGEIRIQDREIVLESPLAALRLGVGTVFQELTLLPYMTVAENLLMGREPRKFGLIDRKATILAAWKLLEDAEISGIEPLELVSNLSLGQRQMVEIVKVVSRKPQILIMDEPTSALAEHEVEWLFSTIRRLRELGTCIIFTSHRWNEIKGIANRITVFRNGESVGTYEAADLSEQDAVERMTGRKLEMYYTEPTPLTAQTTVLEAKQLVGQGLREVSFAAYRGEVLGIGGLAGQGQRELFLALFGVQRWKSGSLEIDGHSEHINSPHDAIRKGIALIPEDRKTEGLLLPLPVRQNLTLPILSKIARSGFIQRNQEQSLVSEMVSRLAIRTPSADQPVGALSGGNQQKVLLGRWLLTKAHILLFYDVTRGVDVATKHEIYELIRHLSEEGHTILFYSTDTEEIAHICHRVLVMREGRIIDEIAGPHIAPEALVAAAIHIPVEAKADNVEVSQ